MIALLVFLLAQAAPDPVQELPKSLQPGAKAEYAQQTVPDAVTGTVRFFAKAGEEKGTVILVREYESKDLGPLTVKTRLTATLDAKTKKITAFTWEIGGKETPLGVASRLTPDPKEEGRFLFEQITLDAKGRQHVKKKRLKPKGFWAPKSLEPFLVALGRHEIRVMDPQSGRIVKKPVTYKPLGEGKLDLDGKKIPCRIMQRTSGTTDETVYFRTADGMPAKLDVLGLTLKVEGR